MTDHSRRQFLAGLGAASASAIGGPFTVTSGDALSGLATAFVRSQSILPTRGLDIDIRQYGGYPSWSISVTDDDLDALEDWVAESDDRRLIRSHEGADVATVGAPAEDVAGSILQGGLEVESWVELVDLDVQVNTVQPRPNVSEDDFGEFGAIERRLIGESSPPTEGLAFEATQSTIGDARETINATTTTSGDGATVAIVDTGVNYDPDIFGREVENEEGELTTESRIHNLSADYTSANDPTVSSQDHEVVADGDGHGTWVAAAAASSSEFDDGEYAGVAPDADILAMKALADDGSGSTADIAAAVRDAADAGADGICMSLGSPVYSADLADAIAYATDAGSTVVAAAGNDRNLTRHVNYPASHPDTIAVGATTTGAPDAVESASFSNVGPAPGTLDFSALDTAGTEVDLGAPGMELQAELPGGLTTLSGTSMAAPFVAGAAALVAQEVTAEDDERAEAVRDRLTETAQPAERIAAAEANDGLVDVEAALNDTPSEGDQSDAMTDEAEFRDRVYRAESDARGGWLSILF